MKSLMWFTNNLRTDDNLALNHACQSNALLAVFIHDTKHRQAQAAARNHYLKNSLDRLQRELKQHDIDLCFQQGDYLTTIKALVRTYKLQQIVCDRAYDPYLRDCQRDLAKWCSAEGIELLRFPGFLLCEPEPIQTQSASPFKVFTPYYKTLLKHGVRKPKLFKRNHAKSIPAGKAKLEDLELYTANPDWAKGFNDLWHSDDQAKHTVLFNFINNYLPDYENKRDQISSDYTSKFSAALNTGELSPARIWHECHAINPEASESFLRQLAWRDFNWYLLYHFPHIETKNFKASFNHFQWRSHKPNLQAWQQGQTGYPIIDAAMRQLWRQGWMPGRARMLVASFLCKHLLIDWRLGEAWFWNCLVDADLANNIGGWQWTAGSGADAAPYFRIFNPITQAQKFDSQAQYIKTWLPELKALPVKYCFAPWQAPTEILSSANVQLGKNYPFPIIDHQFARQRALANWRQSRT